MPSLFAFAAAGAAQGLGQSIVDRAARQREEFLAAQERERELADRADERSYRDRTRREDWSRDDAVRREGWDREDTRTAEERARRADASGRAANVYESLFGTESGGNFDAANSEGYVGRSQFGQARLDDWASANGAPRISIDEFRRNPDLQEEVEQWHFADINDFIDENGLDEYEGQVIKGVPITRSGMIAAAHLGGSGGMRRFLESGGEYDPQDSNGTNLSDYMQTHGGLSTDMGEVWEVLADPDISEAEKAPIRREVERRRGLGVGADLERIGWVDQGDGTERWQGYDEDRGIMVDVPNENGVVPTRPSDRDEDDEDDRSPAAVLGAAGEYRMGALAEDLSKLDRDPTEVLRETAARLAREGMDPEAAVDRAFNAMIFRQVTPAGVLWGEEETKDGPFDADFDGEQVFLGFDFDGDGVPDSPGGTPAVPNLTDAPEEVAKAAPVAPTGLGVGTVVDVPEYPGTFAGTPPAQPAMPGEPGGIVRVTTQDQYNALPSGAMYIAPDGTRRQKP